MSNIPESGESKVQEILQGSKRKGARAWASFGEWFSVGFNMVTTFMFGYFFVRILSTDATLMGLSISGLVGGAISVLLADGMARIWDKTQLLASDSDVQHKVAKMAFLVSTGVSMAMTGVFLIIWISGATSEIGESWVLLGRVIISLLAIGQLVAWLVFKRYSPRYREELVRTTTAAGLKEDILNLKAKAIQKGRKKAKDDIEKYIDHVGDQIAWHATKEALEELGYESGQLPALPALREQLPAPSPSPRMRERLDDDVMIVRPPAQNGHRSVFPNGS